MPYRHIDVMLQLLLSLFAMYASGTTDLMSSQFLVAGGTGSKQHKASS
jgi:hypothetical protein